MPELETLLTGLSFGESPRWHDGCLWFADWGTREIIAVDLDGNREVLAGRASGHSTPRQPAGSTPPGTGACGS